MVVAWEARAGQIHHAFTSLQRATRPPGIARKQSFGTVGWTTLTPSSMNIQTFPSRDRAFSRAVERLVRQKPRAHASELVEDLRRLYPRVAIFQRQLSDEQPLYYAYRDGRFEPEQDEPWWISPGTAVVTVSAVTGLVVDVSDAWVEFMRGEHPSLIGRHFTDFLLPEARDAGVGLFEAVLEVGEVRSEAIVQRVDGTTVAIKFRAILQGDEVEVAYRELT